MNIKDIVKKLNSHFSDIKYIKFVDVIGEIFLEDVSISTPLVTILVCPHFITEELKNRIKSLLNINGHYEWHNVSFEIYENDQKEKLIYEY